MRLTRLFHVVALLALLFAPAGMLGSHAAMAMPHQPVAKSMNHCPEQEGPSQSDRNAILDCAIACAAMPAVAPVLPPERAFIAAVPTAASIQLFDGTRPEAATPPPRCS